MRQFSLIYESEAKIADFVSEKNLSQENLLILMFSDENLEEAKKIAGQIKRLLPQSLLAGASSAGLINAAEIVENRTIIIFLEFKKIKAKGLLISDHESSPAEVTRKIVDNLCSNETKLLFFFQDGLAEKTHLLLSELSAVIPQVPLAGGKAGTNEKETSKTYIFLEEVFTSKGSLAISLTGDYLRICQKYQFNWKKIGGAMRITEAEDNVLKSLNGIAATEVYDKYLGQDFLENDHNFAELGFPFLLERDGMEIARSLAEKLPDGSLYYHGDLRKGEVVHFGYGHVPSIIQSAYEDCTDVSAFQPEGIIIFSCYARKTLLEDDAVFEIEPYADFAPTAGFFTFGEFYHKDEKNHLLNTTMTMVMLSEEPIVDREIEDCPLCQDKKVKFSRRSAISRTLIHLVEEVSKELEERNIILKKMSHTDSMTSLYNHRYFLEALDREVQRSLRYKNNLSVAILDLDNFKEVNDNYGHQTGDQVLKIIANKIKDSCRDTDIVCRYGGDEFVIIFTETGLNEAREVLERIRKNIRELSFPKLDIKMGLSCGLAKLDLDQPGQLMKRADELLYTAKKTGKNSICCSD